MIETLGHYRILDRMASGGFGDVYRARDTSLGRTVAIKVVAAEIAADPDRRERFVRDAQAASALSHPNIAALYEIGEDQDELFLVCEFVPGETLEAAIGGRPLNTRRAIDLAVQIADALAGVHAEGLVDGRLASDLIIVTPKGHAKIVDVGLGAWTRRAGDDAYRSPEQVLGGRADHRTDVFALGVVLFEMLTGRLPFSGGTGAAIAVQIAQATPAAPSATNPVVPRELDAIVAKALAKAPDLRYESAATLAAELRAVGAILDGRSGAIEPHRVSRAVQAPRQRSAVWPAALLLVVAALASAGWWQHLAIERAWRHAFGDAPRPVIAVLPLAQTGSDAARTFFADGLTDDLITRLGQMPGVSVIGRAAVRTYRGRPPADVARSLGAAVMLTGSVQQTGGDVTVALALTNPLDADVLWTNDYTRPAGDIFGLQAQAAEDIAQALHIRVLLSAATARVASRQVDQAAYELYLHGRQAMAEGQAAGAVTYYQDAVTADAGLSEAFAGLARALRTIGARGGPEQTARRERMRTAAERAYQLDPDLAPANVAMGFASLSLPQMLQYLRRAIDLDPSSGDTYRDVADVIRVADPELSAAFSARARELDPQPAVGRVAAAAWRPAAGAAARDRDRDDARRALAGLLESHR